MPPPLIRSQFRLSEEVDLGFACLRLLLDPRRQTQRQSVVELNSLDVALLTVFFLALIVEEAEEQKSAFAAAEGP